MNKDVRENIDILIDLLSEKRLKFHFEDKGKLIKISREDLCILLLEYTKLILEVINENDNEFESRNKTNDIW